MDCKRNMKMESVCRTCMRSTTLRPLFPRPDQLQSFTRALYLSTGLKIEFGDGLPQNICRNCSKIIETAMRFRLRSQAIEKKLLQYFKCKRRTSDVSSASSKNILLEKPVLEAVDKVPEKYEVKIEFEKLDRNTDVESGIDNDVTDLNALSPAPLDPDELSSDDEVLYQKPPYSKPIEIKETEAERKKKMRNAETFDRKRYLELVDGPLDTKRPIQCKICKKYSKSLNTFEKHAMSHLGYNILCEFCAKSCISMTSLLRHQRAKHGLARDNSFPCSFCGFQAIDKEQLEVHERRVHTKERPFTCDDCGAGFFSKRVLIQHRVNHKSDKPYQCDLCPSKFKLRCHLTNHTNRVHNKNHSKYTYGCHICFKRYSSTGDARKHLVKIHGVPLEQQGKVQRFYFQQQDG